MPDRAMELRYSRRVARPDLSGEVLDQRYRILDRISQGAMGVVYRGVRTNLDRHVAIKVMHAALPDAVKMRERFEREAQVMARLDHPHCVSIIDFGIHRNKPFVVMELVRGQSLHDMLVEQGKIEIPRAVDVMRQVLSGLAHAHEQGIIHRDIKPGNIMVTPKAPLGLHVRILDFGLARMLGNSTSISHGVVVGTPSYMAPEQCRGEPVDTTCDVYACGVVLFEMLTGRKPLTASDPIATIKKQMEEPPPRLADVLPGDYRGLEDVVARALNKIPAERFRSAASMSEALDAALGGRTTAESTAVLPASKDEASAMIPITVGSSVRLTRPIAPRAPAPRRVLKVLAVAGIGAAAWWYLWRTSTDQPVARTVTPDAALVVAAKTSPVIVAAAPRDAEQASRPPAVVAPADPVVVAPADPAVVAPADPAVVAPADPAVVAPADPAVVAPADPADTVLADAKALAASGKLDRAIDTLVVARATYPDHGTLPLLAGKLYFSKLWWNDGLTSFHAAFKLDPSLRRDHEVIEAAVKGFLTTPQYDARLAGFVLELGSAAAPVLDEVATTYRAPSLRARAALLAKRLK
jgi:serine/threonine-protein kinase